MSANPTRELRSDSPEQTRRIAATLARNLRPGDIVALEGELGAGKTCFVRGLAEGLGLDPAQVASPTFVLAHEYEPPDPPHAPASPTAPPTTRAAGVALVHIDAYRLRSAEELDAVGWYELIDHGDAIIALEWPSRVASALPADRIDVRIEHAGETSRLVSIAAAPVLADRLQSLSKAAPPASNVERVACRTCGTAFNRSATTFPFCSERCRLADLGTWFREGFRTSRAIEQDDELSE